MDLLRKAKPVIIKTVKTTGKVVAFIIFLYGAFNAGQQLYAYFKNYFFENNPLYEKLIQVNAGATNQYIETLFGKPFIIRKLPKYFNEQDSSHPTGLENLTERIYNDEKFYLQTISDEEDKIIAYSVTTRQKSFIPQIPLNLYRSVLKNGSYVAEPYVVDLKLGKTSFGDLKDYAPLKSGFGSWNQHHFYLEHQYFGRPGDYKEYLFGISPYGVHLDDKLYSKMIDLSFAYDDNLQVLKSQEFLAWRPQDKINVFGVVGWSKGISDKLLDYFFYYGIGPTIDVIYDLR